MNEPSLQQLSTELCVSPQLDTSAMVWIKNNGFKSVINNRHDLEGGTDQPTSAILELAALDVGLRYVHLPVHPGAQTAEEVAHFAVLLAELPKPIVAFCRSGTRSTKLYVAATALNSGGKSLTT
jgi:uncharacterized protein (TIGR01244 family)